MKIKKKLLPNVYLLKNRISNDNRGKFLKIKKKIKFKYNQLCFSFNKKKGTIRGLHYQKKPFSEKKIITCIQGSIFDVIVNCNSKSKNYLKYKTIVLKSNQNNSLYISENYAHGFQTLEDNTIVMYNIDGIFKKKLQSGILWNDPSLKIKWPIKLKVISKKDNKFSIL
jgi:dTDP-4-dehydrorhamnose 3,5-epimerase